MPSLGTARLYIALSSLLALFAWIDPLTGVILIPLAIALGATGILSLPRLPYYQAVLLAIAIAIVPAGAIALLSLLPPLSQLLPYAIAAFSIAPAIALFVLTVRLRQSRSAGIRWIVLSLTLFFVGMGLLLIWMQKGSLTLSAFQSLYKDAKDEFLKNYSALQEQYPQMFENAQLPEDSVIDLFNTSLTLLPGLAIALIWGMAWFTTVCVRWIFGHYVYGADRFANWRVTMTKFAAWVFIICFVLLATPPYARWMLLIPIVAFNICAILAPGFFVVGCRVIKERILSARGCGCFPFLIIGSVFFFTPIAVLFITITGAFRTISPAPAVTFIPIVPPTPPNGPNDPNDPQTPRNPDDQGGPPQA